MTKILEGKRINIQRDQKSVFSADYIAVMQGEVLAVIGPNGAGKIPY